MLRPILLVLVLSAGCTDVEEEEIASSKTPASTIATREASSGAVTGAVDGESTMTQRISSSQQIDARDSYVEFPVAAIRVDTDVTLADGDVSLAANGSLPEELGVDAGVSIVYAAPPVLLSASDGVETATAFVLYLPLPFGAAAAATSSGNDGQAAAALQPPLPLAAASTGKLALLYLRKAAAGNQLGLKIITAADLAGAYLRFEAPGLGWFRVVLLSSAVADVEPLATTREPAAKS